MTGQIRRFADVPLALAALSVSLAAACGGGGDGGAPTEPRRATVAEVEVSPGSATLTSVEDTQQFEATARDASGDEVSGVTFSWRSSDPDVATVDSDGAAVAQASGSVIVEAEARGVTGSAELTVDQEVASVEVTPDTATVYEVGDTVMFSAALEDRNGHTVPGAASWSVDDSAVATVDSTGRVRAEGPGETRVRARKDGVSGHSFFVADTTTPRIQRVEPDPLVPDETAFVHGSNFRPTPTGNIVMVGPDTAEVLAATEHQLEIRVPSRGCRSGRLVDVRVQSGSATSNAFEHPRAAEGDPVEASTGELVRLDGPKPCPLFPAASDSSSYLVGVQSLAKTAESLTSVRIRSRPMEDSAQSGQARWEAATVPVSSRTLRAGGRGRAREPDIGAAIRKLDQRYGSRRLSVLTAHADDDAVGHEPWTEGDTVPIRWRCAEEDADCTGSLQEKDAVVREVGPSVVLLEDTDNDRRLRGDDVAFMSRWLNDEAIYGTIEDYFAPVTDVDDNDRVGVFITEEVNEAGHWGTARPEDLLPMDSVPRRTRSNEAEIVYIRAPGRPVSEEPETLPEYREAILSTATHEIIHVFQFERIHGAGLSSLPVWMMEGGANFGEEAIGFALTRVEPRSNYRNSDIEAVSDAAPDTWLGLAGDSWFATYFGYRGGEPRYSKAPRRCVWFVNDGNDEIDDCAGQNAYHVGHGFLRWLTDHYGPTFGGGDAGMHRELLHTPGEGREVIPNLLDIPENELFAEWAASLFLDDRGFATDDRLQNLTWNYNYDLERHSSGDLRLKPTVRGYGSVELDWEVRAGSSGYLVVEGKPVRDRAVQFTGPDGGPLPDGMQVWVVPLR